MYKMPEPSDIYVRWDGVVIQVTGLCYDESGTLCVEYASKDEPEQFIPVGDWLGIEVYAPFPHPRRFLPLEEFEDEVDEVPKDDPTAPTHSAKITVLESVLNKPNEPIPYLPVKKKEETNQNKEPA